ncbi:hypothetical protein BABINDRAFT_162863 [Babjeviella inositovora NRRL Y-12698]|uniref:Conserved oligomeric Golgi complex subunit 5 n=1 Tax=Babjeviella inositovora NRRL Y-12698 TaxID=984486 RepID=A0A1E3QM83_9ASCO|nr:uncharacterized protein BABINDRAFT_162863 [Babjeviella inositovora NRRL Y-12698]ODQ78192.1 hypothetical protein BABINDRAFT_162863 [Babjeviella inositovora NRRL Y-12698]
MSENPLTDFEDFVTPEFQVQRFANELLLATNSQMDPEVDLYTPEKRLGYDIQEVEKRLVQLTSENYELLIQQVNKMEQTTANLNSLKPSLDQSRRSFRKLENDILEPYDRAQKIYGALRKIHTTSDLLRGVAYFLYLTYELEEEADFELLPAKMLKLANSHSQLQQHLNSMPSLKSMAIVRNYLPVTATKRQQLVDLCYKNVLQSTAVLAVLTDPVIVAQFTGALSTLAAMSPEKARETLVYVMQTHAQHAAQLMIKAVTSPRQFTAVMPEVGTRALLIARIAQLLTTITCPYSTATMSEWMRDELRDSMLGCYWKTVSKDYGKKLHTTMSNGGPVAKNLRNHKAAIREAIEKAVELSHTDDDETAAYLKLMLQPLEGIDIRR